MTQDAGQGQRDGRSGGSDLREVVGLFLRLGFTAFGGPAAHVALMAGVTVQLGRASIVDWLTAALAILATVAIQRGRVNATWVMLRAALLGAASFLLHL